MSLPPGFLEELRTRTSLSQVIGRKVTWDARKSNRGKGDMWAPCPFHQEKTASFHVDDRQGFYYCFGCHAKGDAISFVRETENVGFIDAIEILAREAGMQVPARDPKAQQKADHQTQLAEVMEIAVQFFRLQLKTAAGSAARDYLASRGLDEKAVDHWDIGLAPDGRQTLIQHLKSKEIDPRLAVAAGLIATPEGGGTDYDRFRDRIIFPIRDGRGRCIALGGRAMSENARAKYLNSPETDLFDKSRTLFNVQNARAASAKNQPLIVAEGYMDVIALSQAGFGSAVAPLGTAITVEQLHLMWRLNPEPIIALDGDTAGMRAAMRLIDVALPLLEAGKSLRFAIMPPGQDPDDVLKTGGVAVMQGLLDNAVPMVKLLWQRETEGKTIDSPERRAALDKSLREAIMKIQDKSIRGHYGQEIKDLRWQLFRSSTGRPDGAASARGRVANPRATATSGTRNSVLAAAGATPEHFLREAVILATLIRNPAIIADFDSQLERIDLANPDHQAIQSAVLALASVPPDEFTEKIEQAVEPRLLENLFAPSHVQIVPAVQRPGDLEAAALCVTQELAKLAAIRGAEKEIADAATDMGGLADEGITWRLSQAAETKNRAIASQTEDKTEYETSDSGALVKRDERKTFDELLNAIDYAKGPKRPH